MKKLRHLAAGRRPLEWFVDVALVVLVVGPELAEFEDGRASRIAIALVRLVCAVGSKAPPAAGAAEVAA